MRTALYPGSFNPWHKGHADILKKALQVYDRVIICKMHNPLKQRDGTLIDKIKERVLQGDLSVKDRMDIQTDPENARVIFKQHDGLLIDAVSDFDCQGVIRGLRNGHDLQYEMNLQYINEKELKLRVPTVYFIADQSLSHISSTMYRELENFGVFPT